MVFLRCFSWDWIITKPNIIGRIGRTAPGKTVKLKVVGIFINNQWTLLEGLKMTAGARYNHYSGRFRYGHSKSF